MGVPYLRLRELISIVTVVWLLGRYDEDWMSVCGQHPNNCCVCCVLVFVYSLDYNTALYLHEKDSTLFDAIRKKDGANLLKKNTGTI